MDNRLLKVCHVTSLHSWNDGRIFRRECVSLVKKFNVSLIAPNVDDTDIEGVHIVGVKLPQRRISRMLNLGKVYKKMVEVDADIYHFHDPELLPVGIKIKRKLSKKIIFDSHEDVPVHIRLSLWIPSMFRSFVAQIYSIYERRVLTHYDAVISVAPNIVERLSSYNPNTFQVTNYPILDIDESSNVVKNQICFTGGVDPTWMHENVLMALQSIDCRYAIAGWGSEGYIDKLKSLPAWQKVDYYGRLSFEQCKELQKESLLGVAVLDYVGSKQGTLGNTKMFEYMMRGIPLVATDYILWKEIIEGNNCGKCVNPHSVEEISQAIRFYVDHPEEAKRQGMNGRRIVREKYNWATQEEILFSLYESII